MIVGQTNDDENPFNSNWSAHKLMQEVDVDVGVLQLRRPYL